MRRHQIGNSPSCEFCKEGASISFNHPSAFRLTTDFGSKRQAVASVAFRRKVGVPTTTAKLLALGIQCLSAEGRRNQRPFLILRRHGLQCLSAEGRRNSTNTETLFWTGLQCLSAEGRRNNTCTCRGSILGLQCLSAEGRRNRNAETLFWTGLQCLSAEGRRNNTCTCRGSILGLQCLSAEGRRNRNAEMLVEPLPARLWRASRRTHPLCG
jgi:hypothetical protein